MEAENDTNTPVNYEQSSDGGGDAVPGQTPRCPQTGNLEAAGKQGNRRRFRPGCPPPWKVTFTDPGDPGKQASSPRIPAQDANATVKLNADWTVTVTSKPG